MAINFDKLSDAELDRMVENKMKQSQTEVSLESLPDEELDRMVEQKMKGSAPPAQAQTNVQGAAPSRAGEARLAGFGQIATGGYLPQLQAGAEKIASKLGFSPTDTVDQKLRAMGFNIPEEQTYVQIRDENIRRIQELESKEPKGFLQGSIAGAVASAPLVSKAVGAAGIAQKATTLSQRLGTALKTGGVISFLQNPGDTEGIVDPVQIRERLEGGAKGALLSVPLQGAGEVVGATFRGFTNIPKRLKNLAQVEALKSSGAIVGDLKKQFAKGKVNDIGKTLLDHGIVSAGDNIDDIARKTALAKNAMGSKIGKIYEDTNDFLLNLNEENLLPKEKALLSSTKINARKLANDIFEESIGSIRTMANGASVQKRLEDALKPLASLGDDARLIDINDYRKSLGDIINFDKTIAEMPGVEKILTKSMFKVQEAALKRISVVDNISKTSNAKELISLNRSFSNLSIVNKLAINGVARENASKGFGLKETIVGAAVGASSKDPFAGIATAYAVNKLSKYAGPVTAVAANKAAGLLARTPESLGKYSQPLFEAASKSPRDFTIIVEQFLNDPEFKKKIK